MAFLKSDLDKLIDQGCAVAEPGSITMTLDQARDIRKRLPEIERLFLYQDLDAHQGTIYRAAGWKQAENYKGKAHGWEPGNGGGSSGRVGRRDKVIAPRMRWERIILQHK